MTVYLICDEARDEPLLEALGEISRIVYVSAHIIFIVLTFERFILCTCRSSTFAQSVPVRMLVVQGVVTTQDQLE